MNKLALILVCCLLQTVVCSPLTTKQVNGALPKDVFRPRERRQAVQVIEDCLTVTSTEGLIYVKESPKDEGPACGIYLIGDPEHRIEIEFAHIEVPCEDGGLISVVDGWEMNGEYFPSAEDHHLPLEDRVASICGANPSQKRFLSSQNAALILYTPGVGQGFSLRVRYVKNPEPCNILVEGSSDVYTLSNHGRHVNCSVTLVLTPSTVKIHSLQVGAGGPAFSRHSLFAMARPGAELIHKCQEKGMRDYVQIGGSNSLNVDKMTFTDSLCGRAAHIKDIERTIGCEVTTVRLVSSGRFHNTVKVEIRRAEDEELYAPTFSCY